jgi:hypothetical protein
VSMSDACMELRCVRNTTDHIDQRTCRENNCVIYESESLIAYRSVATPSISVPSVT